MISYNYNKRDRHILLKSHIKYSSIASSTPPNYLTMAIHIFPTIEEWSASKDKFRVVAYGFSIYRAEC